MAELTDAHDKAKRRLDRAKPRALAEGLEEVERYVAQNNIEGVRGTILDLIEVRDARCMTAVEVRPHCCVCVCVCVLRQGSAQPNLTSCVHQTGDCPEPALPLRSRQ